MSGMRRKSVRGSVPLEAPKNDVEITVVIVPPNGAGIGYGHNRDGDCVTVEGERTAMLELFHHLRQASRERRKLWIATDDYPKLTVIERTACPTHVLPEIGEDAAVAWAPY